jgi:AcrR family transcriptional regulator
MEKLDSLVAEHIADRLLEPERLEEILASILDRRQERAERRREHIAELNKRAAETDLRLKRLYDAIEAGVADLDDPALKERIASLKAIRDQAQADAAMLERSGQQAITPQMVQRFTRTARERIRIDGGGYRPRPSPGARPTGRGRRSRGPHHRFEEQSASDADRRGRRKIGFARRSQFCSEVAEREGFEPSVPRKRDNGFRDRPVRPLRHLSASLK